jgi:MoaA/NifB/PqqE/SkfB family radical SAM enzyme
MNWEVFRNLIDQIATENPYAAVRLHKDGEPLLHPEIIKFVDYASSRLHDVLLVTNATLLTEDISHAILSTQLQTIRFSVDGNTKETFEKIRKQSPRNPYRDKRVPVDYDSVISNIYTFCELKKSLGRSFPKVGMRITSFKATQKELTNYVTFWKKRVDFVSVAAFASWSGGQLYQDKIDYSQRYPCIQLWDSMTINWDGTMAPCCVYVDTIGDKRGILGDLNSLSIMRAWNSPLIQKLRIAHLDNDLDEVAPFCKHCSDWRISSVPGDRLWTENFKSEMRTSTLLAE